MNFIKVSYKIALLSKNFAWQTILTQEGAFFDVIENNEFDKFQLIITTSESKINKKKFFDYISNGGLAICEADKFSYLSNENSYRKKVNFLISEPDKIYSEIGLIDIQNEINIIKSSEYLDKNLKIVYKKIGKGHLIIIPFNLKKIFSNHSFSRKKFYFKRKELPSEDVSNISKYKFMKMISISLYFLFDKKNLPYITKWYYSYKKFESVFIFRIDTDFCNFEDAKNLFHLIEKYKIHSTWFVDTSSKKNLKELYSKFPENHEVGLHAYRHLVFKNFLKNKLNIEKGLTILRKYNINPRGFAAPFGEWNITLQKAIEIFDYSSEFAFDYDNFPSFPFVASSFSKTLQIPPHPISIGRLIRSHFSPQEMIKYYQDVINYLTSQNLPIIIYHHPHHKHFEVIEAIFKYVIENTEKLNMHSFYKMWIDRLNLNYNIILHGSKIKNVKSILKIKYKNRVALIQKDINLSDINFVALKKYKVPNDIYRIRKFHWRDWLYNYEKKRSKKRL